MNLSKKIKLLVCYHKKDILFKNDVFVPIHCGRALARATSKDGKINQVDYQWMLDNMIGDDTGENISELNRCYNELTAIYWAWKNYEQLGNPDYIGLCHYRRLFDNCDNSTNDYSIKRIYDSLDKILDCIDEYDIMCPNDYLIPESDRSFCNFEYGQNFVKLSENNYPELNCQYEKFKEKHIIHWKNMFIMKKDLFFKYCEIIFGILNNIYENNMELQKDRAIGFIAEYLTSFIIDHFITEGNKVKKLNIIKVLDTYEGCLSLVKLIIKNKYKNISLENRYKYNFDLLRRLNKNNINSNYIVVSNLTRLQKIKLFIIYNYIRCMYCFIKNFFQ